MKLFSWLMWRPKASERKVKSRRAAVASPSRPSHEARDGISVRRERVYLVVRETLHSADFDPDAFKFKVATADRVGMEFLVLVDLGPPSITDDQRLASIGKRIQQRTKAQFGLKVLGVYWRFEALGHRPESFHVPAPRTVRPPGMESPVSVPAALHEHELSKLSMVRRKQLVRPTPAVGAMPAGQPGSVLDQRPSFPDPDEFSAFNQALGTTQYGLLT